jgi:hypothetical protein
VKVPTAAKLNCVVTAMVASEGATSIELRLALSTSRFVWPLIPPAVAAITVEPGATLVAVPTEDIVATEVDEEFQLTAPELARLRVLPSTKVPLAMKRRLVPFAMIGLVGETDTAVRLDKSTERSAVLLNTPPNDAVMETGPPTLLPTARPVLVVMNTIPGCEEVHVQTLVTSCVLLSLNVPIAVNCCCVPQPMVLFPGLITMDTGVAVVTVRLAVICGVPV